MAPQQGVTIRRLPGGESHRAVIDSVRGNLLRVQTLTGTAGAALKATDLVEVESPQTLYLGEVQGKEGDVLIISLEHTVDRATLHTIQQVWYRPQGE